MIDAGVDSPLGEVLPLVRSVVGGVDVGELEASKTGTPVGPAIASSEMAGLFEDLPALAAAFRDGRLSEVQASEVAEVAMEVPDAEEQLVEAAGKLSLKELREESASGSRRPRSSTKTTAIVGCTSSVAPGPGSERGRAISVRS